MKKPFDEKAFTFKATFDADRSFRQYKSNALSVFTLSLYLNLDDLSDFAANAITEGPNDKKVDISYLDLNKGRAVIAQSYMAESWGKAAAPANKASDLNTAMSWLISANRIPRHLRATATELRRALSDGDIRRIEILYIHNCHESVNVENELKAASEATRDKVSALIGESEPPVITYREFGLAAIEEIYRARESEILVDGWIKVPVRGYVQERGKGWRAVLTTVPGKWIQRLHKEHGDRLFSANYRDYLGATNRAGNINREITQTAESEPRNFWIYNNGITALTYEIQLKPRRRIRGISIINGAQTSGALSDATPTSVRNAKVPIRFVECASRELIDKIIRYNNTQNEIRPADRRSNDPLQRRLCKDFEKYHVPYVHRRSFTRMPRNALTSAAIAPALCAFHGDPQTAYRNAKEILLKDDVYEKVFAQNISVEHIFLVKALSSAIDKVKAELKAKVSNETATKLEAQQYDALKYSGSKHFIFYLIGSLAEEIMATRVADLFEWKCKPNVISGNNVSMQKAWEVSLGALLPQIAMIVETYGKDASYEVPRSTEKSKEVSKKLTATIASLRRVLGSEFDDLRQRSTI